MYALTKRLLLVALLVATPGAPAFAQAPPLRGAEPPGEPGIAPGELQRLFDAYALLQAQDQLKIGGDQSLQFLARFRDLQDARRKALMERTRRIAAMRRLLNGAQPDEAQLREQIMGVQELDARAAAEIKKAYDAIDQLLDVRQQARFRVFEEQMERRKFDLVTRARQINPANRGRQQ